MNKANKLLSACSRSFKQSSDKSKNHHLTGRMESAFAVFPKSAAFIRPAKRLFHDPAPGEGFEVTPIAALNNLNISANGVFDIVGKMPARVSAVTKNVDNMGQGRLTGFIISRAPALSELLAVVT